MSTDRLLVEESIHDEFIEKVKHVLGTEWRQPFPLVLASGAMKVRALVQDALDKGASLAYGVQSTLTDADMEYHHKKTTLPGPTLVTGVTKEMDMSHLENFGPVMSVMTFNNEEEGIKLANDTTYGLSASVWTKDLAKGIRVAQEIVSGYVNSVIDACFTVTYPLSLAARFILTPPPFMMKQLFPTVGSSTVDLAALEEAGDSTSS